MSWLRSVWLYQRKLISSKKLVWIPAFAGVTFLFLTACGFTPVYQKGGAVEELSRIEVNTPDNREGQLFQAALEDKLAPSGMKASYYTLNPNLAIRLEPLSIESDGTTRRYRIIASSNLALTDNRSGEIIFRDSVERFSSYHISDADFSTYIAGKEATRQVMESLADDIHLRLIAYFASKKV